MTVKAHLVEADSPIQQGSSVEAVCGAQIKNALAVYMVDYQNLEIAFSLTGFCKKCAKDFGSRKRRYAYGIVNGQEAQFMEESA